MMRGTNVLAFPGTYDFAKKRATWQLFWWYDNQSEYRIDAKVYPQVHDVCSLKATFDLDEPTARKWRSAFDAGTLRLIVWFRLAAIAKARWKGHPFLNDGSQVHDIVFQPTIVKFKASMKDGGTAPKTPRKPKPAQDSDARGVFR
jgi:hypothetical protein